MDEATTLINPQLTTITPELARQWLDERHPPGSNRRLNDHKVKQLAAAMTAGLFGPTNDCLVFMVDGTLGNGQHRLEACVKSGVMVQAFVVWDAPMSWRPLFDGGSCGPPGRTPGQVLQIERQAPYPNDQSACIKVVLDWEAMEDLGLWSGGRRGAPSTVVLARYDKDPEGFLAAVQTGRACRKRLPPGRGLELVVFTVTAYWFRSHLDDEAVQDSERFFEQLGLGTNLAENDPIYQLRRKLLEELTGRQKYELVDRCAWVTKAWNFYRRGQQCERLSWNPARERFPVPV